VVNEEAETKAIHIYEKAVSSVNPYITVKRHVEALTSFCREKNIRQVFVVGFGKASVEMARGVNDSIGDIIDRGLVITKYSHARGTTSLGKIQVFEAAHPVPDGSGLMATRKIIELLKRVDNSTLVICLISGGGSALLVSPIEPVTLEEKQITTKLLLEAGANINDVNAVRKHISYVKGGRLAQLAYPAYIRSLILSDVVGDKLDVIASGPTTFDPTTYDDAIEILKKFRLLDRVPRNVIDVLNKGKRGEISETVKEGDPVLANTENTIIGSNKMALAEARKAAIELGFNTSIISTELEGEAKDVGKWLAEIAKACKIKKEESRIKKPICLLSGGETTVTVVGSGKGGRNTELALAFALEIEGIAGIFLLSAGTDGTDGPTDAAGAFVTGDTVKKARMAGISPEEYLKNNDSYHFFKKVGGLYITGPTGTNVMDVQIILIY